MSTQTDKPLIDLRSIITGILVSTLVSISSFVWMMGAMENRINVLERDSSKVDQVLVKVTDIGEKVAVMNNDLTYVKQNMNDLKVNSNGLSDDVRTLRMNVAELQRGHNNGR